VSKFSACAKLLLAWPVHRDSFWKTCRCRWGHRAYLK